MAGFGSLFEQGAIWHFGTPIYTSLIRSNKFDQVQKDLDTVYNTMLAEDKFQHHRRSRSHMLSDTTFSSNFIEEYKLENFQEELEFQLMEYLKGIGSDIGTVRPFTYKITSSWMTLNKKDSYAVIHSHGRSDISGVYYFKTNGEDGDIFFESPNKVIHTSYVFSHFGRSWSHKPQVGKIILFPGWLEHGVATNHTDNDRVSISFNIDFIK